VVINASATEKSISTGRFGESMKGASQATEIISNTSVTDLSTLKIPAQTAMILELN